MKKLILILIVFVFVGCKYVAPFIVNDNIFDEWTEYKKECYNDSTMVISELNSGEFVNGEMVFDTDTSYVHKQAVWENFLKQKDEKSNKNTLQDRR